MEIRDSTNPEHVRGGDWIAAGYIDGPESEWPAEAWDSFGTQRTLRGSVLADPAATWFDYEGDNAPIDKIGAAVLNRIARQQISFVYSDKENVPAVLAGLNAKAVHPLDASSWPQVGCYLWVPDITNEPHNEIPGLPIRPAIVQHTFAGTYDESSTYGSVLAEIPIPEPHHPAGGIVSIQVPELQTGSEGPAVLAVQKLIGGLALDGIFGPLTAQAVRVYQQAHHLTVDGIVGPHTWGALVGDPQ